MMQAYDTYDYLKKNGEGRPFIIIRSNTLGSNRYAFHWTGDNYANFDLPTTSIPMPASIGSTCSSISTPRYSSQGRGST